MNGINLSDYSLLYSIDHNFQTILLFNMFTETFELTNTQNSSIISTSSTCPDAFVDEMSENTICNCNPIMDAKSKHDAAILLLCQYDSILKTFISEQSYDSIIRSEIPSELKSIIANFKPKISIEDICRVHTNLLKSHTTAIELAKAKNTRPVQEQKKRMRKLWNDSLTWYRGILMPKSTLMNLLFMNGTGFYEVEVKHRDFTDISTLSTREESDVVCKVRCVNSINGFHRVKRSSGLISDSPEEMARRLMIYVQDIMDPTDLSSRSSNKNSIYWIDDIFMELVLTIRIPETDPETGIKTNNYSVINCNEPRVLQNFFGGSFPGFRRINELLKKKSHDLVVKYQLFYRFAKLIRTKIFQLINSSSGVSSSKWANYAVIRCPRVHPKVCGYETIATKRSYTSFPHICKDCTMELCPEGCGRAHHGGHCDIPMDDASAAFISNTSTICPGCNVPIHKYTACNHITCPCGVHFCYVCGHVYQKDINGQVHAAVTEHHMDLLDDGISKCPLH